jgi:hypothetical protein
MNTKILHINIDVFGGKDIYQTSIGENTNCFTIVNGSMVNVCQLAKSVWSDKRYIKAIETKAEAAHEKGLLHRLPPMANAIFAEVGQVEELFAKWCHRDPVAKTQLSEFDFKTLCAHIKAIRRTRLRRFLTEHDEQSAAKRRRITDALDALSDE